MSQFVDLNRMHVFEVGGVVVYQLLCGRDLQGSMDNYIYLIVNMQSRTAVVVDAAWDLDAIFKFAESLKVRITIAVYTHFHADHAGGRGVPGCAELLRRGGVEAWAGELDAEQIRQQNNLQSQRDQLRELRDGDLVALDSLALHVVHTPGHTPGSICLYLPAVGQLTPRGDVKAAEEILIPTKGGLLISGDTLFVGSAGRTDLVESNHGHMLESMARLTKLAPDTLVLPGHNYDPLAYTTIDMERLGNCVMASSADKEAIGRPLPPCCICAGLIGPLPVAPGQRVEILESVPDGELPVIAVVESWLQEGEAYRVRLLPGQGKPAEQRTIPAKLLKPRGRTVRGSIAMEDGPEPVLYEVIEGTLLRKEDPCQVTGKAAQKVSSFKRGKGSKVYTTGKTWTGAQGTTWVQLHPAREKRGGWLALHGKCFGLDAVLLRPFDSELASISGYV